MKSRQEFKISRLLLVALTVAAAGLQVSCSTSTDKAWSKIQSDGLIPYIVDGHAERTAMESPIVETSNTSPSLNLEPRESTTAVLSRGVTAKQVPGKNGFVYSPHLEGFFQVDVRGYKAGERVRCPYTKRSFTVPGQTGAPVGRPLTRSVESQVVSAPERSLPAAGPDVAEPIVKPEPRVEPKPMVVVEKEKPEPKIIEPLVKPKVIASGPDKIPTSDEILDLPKPKPEPSNVPVGKRVPGKPNYVYSPFAASNQVVDVEGHAPGTKVKCPYTGKVFAVPGN